MRLVLIGLTTLAALTTIEAAQIANVSETYAGQYSVSFAGMGGQSLTLRPDGTFEYTMWTDLTRETTEGTWSIVAPQVLEISSTATQPPSRVSSSTHGRGGRVRYIVLDEADAPLPGAKIVMECHGKDRREATTDRNGTASAKNCDVDSFSVSFPGFEEATYERDSSGDDQFVVTMSESLFLVDQERWFFMDDQLFPLRWPLTR